MPGIAALYDKRVGKPANREGDGKQVINRLEIDRTAYNPISRQPVLFGSSLKGSMRTALLDWKNQGQHLLGRETNRQLQQRLLDFRAGKFELDPLRLVQLADAAWQGGANLPAAQVHLAVNRKKHPVKDASGQLRKAMGENLYQILECVPGWHYRAFSCQLNLQYVGGIAAIDRLPAESLRFDIEQIARACHDFYKDRMDTENQILRDRGFINPAWDKAVADALGIAQTKIEAGQAFLLRVGRHSGAESVTLNGARNGHIKIMKGKGQSPDYADAAKTLWLAADEKDQTQNLHPFGWLLVEIQPLDEKPQDWPELQKLCAPHLETARAFAKKRESQREALAQARAETEAKRHEEAEQARLKAEKEAERARQKAERQAQLAAMSAQARQVEAFRQRLETEGKNWAKEGLGGGWFRDLSELAKSAEGWTPQDRAAMLALVEAISQLAPGLHPKKNDRIKKLIKNLQA